MNKELLREQCDLLEKIIVGMAEIYQDKTTTQKNKGLMETMIGAAIWYLPSGDEMFTGKISEEALALIESGTPLSKLTKEHRYPRKQAGRILLTEEWISFKEGKSKLIDLYLRDFGKYNYVEKKENHKLIKFQGANFVDEETSYAEAGINLVNMSLNEIKDRIPPKERKRKKKDPSETEMQTEAQSKFQANNYIEEESSYAKAENKPALVTFKEVNDKIPPKHRKGINKVTPEMEMRTNGHEKMQKSPKKKKSITRGLKSGNEKSIQKLNTDDKKGNAFTGIDVDDISLISGGNPSQCYKAFLEYILENYENRIPDSPTLSPLIKKDPRDSGFGGDLNYRYVIKEHKNYYFSIHAGTNIKKERIINIAKELNIRVNFLYT